MTQTIPHFTSLESAIASLYTTPVHIVRQSRISGGDINDAFSLTLSNNQKIFMKANTHADVNFFEAEATGLAALASCGKLATPKIIAIGTQGRATGENQSPRGDVMLGGANPFGGIDFSFLLLEYINSSRPNPDYWRTFGRELAELHKSDSSQFSGGKKFGFFADNFIGQTKQQNTPNDSWVDFFRESRLIPQIKMASHYFDNSFRAKLDLFLNRLDKILIEPDFPSLLHGDLWRGNVYCGSDGKAMLIDPATYVGFYEADLAMTELFGRFPKDFYDGYYEVTPKLEGYETRRGVYNLYQLLNHLNLFGEGYLNSVWSIINKFLP